MNTDWAIAELDKFIEQTIMRNGSHAGFITSSDHTAAPDVEVARQAQIVEKILDRVLSNWRTEVSGRMANNHWSRHRESAIRAREELIRKQEVEENLGENAPELSAAELHPWVWEVAKSLWSLPRSRRRCHPKAQRRDSEQGGPSRRE